MNLGSSSGLWSDEASRRLVSLPQARNSPVPKALSVFVHQEFK
jgi:hypothetical protein